MTQPGTGIYPRPGWWPRTNRAGTTEVDYGWTVSAQGATPMRGSASGDYGWVGTATGERMRYGAASGDYGWAGTAVGEHTIMGATAYVATSEYTDAYDWVDLTTTTDYVTFYVPASGIVGVSITALIGSTSTESYIGYALSGANTRSAGFSRCFGWANCTFFGHGGVFLETGLTPGPTTFKMKYYSDDSYIEKRRISVFRLET